MSPKSFVCAVCGAGFESVRDTALYCSTRCKQTAKARRHRGSRNRRAVLCALESCERIAESGRYCYTHQARLRRSADMDAPIVTPLARVGDECSVTDCGSPIYYRNFCRYHYQVDGLERGLAGSRDYFRPGGSRHESRAAAYGVRAEKVDRLAVFERDDWVCGICGDRVDPMIAYPSPWSPSLDHVVPSSRGGEHVESNCQCSHLVCNVSKCDRLADWHFSLQSSGKVAPQSWYD